MAAKRAETRERGEWSPVYGRMGWRGDRARIAGRGEAGEVLWLRVGFGAAGAVQRRG